MYTLTKNGKTKQNEEYKKINLSFLFPIIKWMIKIGLDGQM